MTIITKGLHHKIQQLLDMGVKYLNYTLWQYSNLFIFCFTEAVFFFLKKKSSFTGAVTKLEYGTSEELFQPSMLNRSQ